MQSMTPTVAPATGPKPGRSTYVRWFLAIAAIPVAAFFLLSVAATAGAEWGVVGVVVGLALFPVTLLVVPFYAGIVNGEWMLVGLMVALFAAAWVYHRFGRDVRASSSS
jgi:hypothetical protein